MATDMILQLALLTVGWVKVEEIFFIDGGEVLGCMGQSFFVPAHVVRRVPEAGPSSTWSGICRRHVLLDCDNFKRFLHTLSDHQERSSYVNGHRGVLESQRLRYEGSHREVYGHAEHRTGKHIVLCMVTMLCFHRVQKYEEVYGDFGTISPTTMFQWNNA